MVNAETHKRVPTPLFDRFCKVLRPWALLRETTVIVYKSLKIVCIAIAVVCVCTCSFDSRCWFAVGLEICQ